MIRRMDETLTDWAGDDRVSCVLLESSSARGFCAGGDVRTVRERVRAGSVDDGVTFFREEYRLNQLIAGRRGILNVNLVSSSVELTVNSPP